MSEAAVAPLVQVTDQTQGGVFITDGLANGIQILDGSFPLIQGTDGNIIQLAQPVMSGGSTEGLTQVLICFLKKETLVLNYRHEDKTRTNHIYSTIRHRLLS